MRDPKTQKALALRLRRIEGHTGHFYTDRINLALNPERKSAILDHLAAAPDRIGPFRVEKRITTDGYKFILPHGEWIAFRASGTEPLIRAYLEARSAPQLEKMRRACQTLLKLK